MSEIMNVELCCSDFFCQGEWCLIKAQPKIQNSIPQFFFNNKNKRKNLIIKSLKIHKNNIVLKHKTVCPFLVANIMPDLSIISI